MAERMTEAKVAELEAELRRLEREEENVQVGTGPMARLRTRGIGFGNPALQNAGRAFLDARAQFDSERRADAEAAQAAIVEANQEMADASREAARFSAEAAVAARSAARWTLAAAVVALLGVAVQAWQAWVANPPAPVQEPTAKRAG